MIQCITISCIDGVTGGVGVRYSNVVYDSVNSATFYHHSVNFKVLGVLGVSFHS